MKSFLVFTLLFIHSGIVAQVKEKWEVVVNDSSSLSAEGLLVKTDNGGNIIVAGITTTGSAGDDILVAKYNSTGSLIWKQTYNGIGDTADYPTSLLIDENENVYVAGISRIDSFTIELVVIKYNSNGNLLWQTDFQNWAGNGILAQDKSENILVAGCSFQINNSGYFDEYITTLQYSPQGILTWARVDTFGAANSIQVNSKNEIYVTGPARDGVYYSTILIKYDSLGNRLWRKWYGADTYFTEYPLSSCLDTDENIYQSAVIDEGGLRSNLILKYDSAGTLLYHHRIDTFSTLALGQWIATDPNNNLCFLDNYINEYFKIYRFADNGTLNWSTMYNGPNHLLAVPEMLSVDEAGNIYSCGFTSLDFRQKAVLLKHDSEGNLLWEFMNDGLVNHVTDRFNSLALKNNSVVYVVGTSEEAFDPSPDFILIKIEPCENAYSPLITGPDTICANQTGVSYSVPNMPGNIYSWFIGGGTIGSGDSTNTIEINWGDGGGWPMDFNTVNEGAGLVLAYIVDSEGCILNPIEKWVTIQNCTGMNSTTEQNDWVVSPNPFNSNLILHNQSSSGNVVLVVRDLYGRIVKSKTFIGKNCTWNLPDLNPGIYLMEIANGDSSEEICIVKQ